MKVAALAKCLRFYVKVLYVLYMMDMGLTGQLSCMRTDFFVAPALATCDIGIRFSVRQSVRLSFRPQFTLTLAFKFIQMINSLKPLHP